MANRQDALSVQHWHGESQDRFSGARLVRLLLLLLCLFFSVWAAAAPAQDLTLHDAQTRYHPYALLQHNCTTAAKSPELAQLTAPNSSVNWQQGSPSTPNFGFTGNSCWFRLTLHNQSSKQWLLRLQYAQLAHISYALIAADGTQLAQGQAGSAEAISDNTINSRLPTFALPIPHNSTATLYLQVASYYSLQLPMVISDRQSIVLHDQRDNLIQGLFFGALLVMLLYNLLLLLSLRERAYLLYVCWSAVVVAFWASYNGFAQQYLWPQLPQINGRFLSYCLPFIVLLPPWFTLEFLKLKRHSPPLYQLLVWNLRVGLLLLAATPFIPRHLLVPIDAVLILVSNGCVLLAVYVRLIAKDRNAGYLALAWSCLLAGAIAICLGKLNLLPVSPLTTQLAQIGSLLDITLLSLALGARISYLKKDRDDLRDAQNKARIEALQSEAMSQAKGSFLDTISLQVRAPMQQVLGLLDLLEQSSLDDQQQQYLRTIGHSSQQMLREVNDIIDYSHIREGKLKLNSDDFSLEQLIDDCISGIATQANAKQLPIYLYIDRQLPSHFVGDAVRIRQLIGNLLDNAVKFTHSGKVSLHIILQQAADKGGNCMLRFEVADSGCGISKQQQTQLLTESATQAAEHDDNNQLGLVICDALSRMMRGKLAINSAPGRGTTVSVYLPLKVAAGLAPALAGHQLTLISNNRLLALSLSQLVERWGMHFSHCDTLSGLAESPAQLLLLDGDFAIPDSQSLEALSEHHQLALLRSGTTSGPLATITRQLSLPLSCRALFALCRNASHQASVSQWPAPTDQPLRLTHALVVSTSQLTRMLLDNLLRQQHITTSLYGGETDAGFWQKATNAYQLLLIDEEQQADPLGLITRIKETGRLQNGPEPWAILVATHLPMNSIERARAAGVDDFLLKPVTEEQLLRLLGTAGFLKRRAADRLPTTLEKTSPTP